MFHNTTVCSALAVVLVFLNALRSGVVTSIAPGDEDTLCTREPYYAQPYHQNQRFLFDSYHYQSLFRGALQQLDVDGEGQGVRTEKHTH